MVCGDSGSQSSSGKDSGHGEDIPDSLGIITDAEEGKNLILCLKRTS